jgi:hypothetical protein
MALADLKQVDREIGQLMSRQPEVGLFGPERSTDTTMTLRRLTLIRSGLSAQIVKTLKDAGLAPEVTRQAASSREDPQKARFFDAHPLGSRPHVPAIVPDI